jgi:hypothetical protein
MLEIVGQYRNAFDRHARAEARSVFALDDPRIHQYKVHFSKRDELPGAQISLPGLRKADHYARQ